MRIWERAPVNTLCGGICGGTIRVGQPMLVLTFPVLAVRKYRCERCAEEPVPADLPPLGVHEEIKPSALVREGRQALPFGSFAGSKTLRDFKQAAAGRDPGEEG